MNTMSECASDYISDLMSARFWGTVTFKFQDGKLIHVAEERSLKPEQLVPEYRRKNGATHS